MIKVKATRQGFFGGALIEIGEEFEIQRVDQLGSWMERLDGKENPAIAKLIKSQNVKTIPLIDPTKIEAGLNVDPLETPAKPKAASTTKSKAKKPELNTQDSPVQTTQQLI